MVIQVHSGILQRPFTSLRLDDLMDPKNLLLNNIVLRMFPDKYASHDYTLWKIMPAVFFWSDTKCESKR
jgi:hypothetical protein